jgi:transcriptional regulator with XRE-family HTH domain
MMTEPMINLADVISKNVKAERLRQGLSQQKLADLTGLSVRYISRLETEPQNIRVDKVGVIARAIGVTPERLLQKTEDVTKPPNLAVSLSEVIRSLQALHAQVS